MIEPFDSLLSLAIETSGRVGSVALARGAIVLEARSFGAALRHAAELLPTVAALCDTHGVTPDQLQEVHVSGGPGSFTGVRIGVTFARTLALATGVKVVRVPTFDVIAQNALAVDPPPATVAVILDAKRQRVFAAPFALTGGSYRRVQEPQEVAPDDFLSRLPGDCALLGEGIAYHGPAVARSGLLVLPEDLNRARAEVVHRLGYDLARQGRFDDPNQVVPIYLRPPEAEELWDRKHPRQ